jgi:hypothetical protein
MLSKIIRVAAVLVVGAVCALAADITGKWTAQVTGRGGQAREATFTFKVDGDKLTGNMSDGQTNSPIADGKVSGDTITFSVETQRGKRTYTGTVTGGEIKFKREGGQNRQEFTAKRAVS